MISQLRRTLRRVRPYRRLLQSGVLGLAVTMLAMAVFLDLRPPAALTAGAWGLSFPNPGQTPSGPASTEQLASYNAIYTAPDPTEKVLYLTFDAGYENGYTSQILDVLKDHQVPAAFFLVGSYLERNPELVQRMVSEGHLVGNHTMTHPDMSAIEDRDAFARELEQVEALYASVTGQTMPKYYRPPRGLYSETNLALARDLGYRTIFWSLAYADWNNDAQPSYETAFEKLLGRVHPGAVVLLHSTSRTNAAILHDLIGRWKEMGYRFGCLADLYPESEGSPIPSAGSACLV